MFKQFVGRLRGRGHRSSRHGARVRTRSASRPQATRKRLYRLSAPGAVDAAAGYVGTDDTDSGLKSLHLLVQDPGLTVEELVKTLKRTVEDVNSMDLHTENYGPIHYLVSSHHKNKTELLMALLVHSNANINLTTTVNGSTALHLAVEANDLESARALVALGADVNVLDLVGHRSPLDIAQLKARNKLPIPSHAVALDTLPKQGAMLLSSQVASMECSSDVTAVHTSRAQSNDSDMVTELESVGALPGLQCLSAAKEKDDLAGATSPLALKVRVDDLTCSTHYRELDDSITPLLEDDNFDPSAEQALMLVKKIKEKAKYQRKYGSRILSLGGGGIRGLVQIEILQQIERSTGKKITDLFDWIVGTSTGGIIALALVYGEKSLEELRRIYLRMKDSVFSSKGILCKGNSSTLKSVLIDWFGKDTVMSDKFYPKVLIPAVYKERSDLELHFFNNCFDDKYSKDLIWKVAYRTSAAPFYFKEEDNYIDGGILANNPCEDALTAIQQFYETRGQRLPISLLVSVGSGKNPPKKLKSTINFGFERFFNQDLWLDFLEVLESAVLNPTTVQNCESRCKEQGIQFFHFNPDLEEKIESNETNNLRLLRMLWRTRVYMHQQEVFLKQLVNLLKQSAMCGW